MTRINLAKLGRVVNQTLPGRAAVALHATRSFGLSKAPLTTTQLSSRHANASFSTSSRFAKPIAPDALKTAKPADITDSEYHELADTYLEHLLVKFEEMQDATDEVDVDYSAGVMSIKFSHGAYVINKQPPNKQIWLSSPKSGPKRYDWVVISEDQNSKQDTATGGWIYLRDGTSLTELLYTETGVDIGSTEDDLD